MSLAPPPTIRLRYHRGQVGVSAEDLRRSGDEDLKRLAEADRRRSQSLVSRGNEDGWVTVKEVEAAIGIHTSIVGGYYALLKKAQTDRPETLSLTETLALMKVGGQGAIKLRVPPKEQPAPTDPILEAPGYDPRHRSARPRFLDAQRAAIEKALGPNKPGVVTRGFSLPGYGGPELVRYLYGDWRGVIASHTFSATLRDELQKGAEFHRAIDKTATKIAAQIIRDVEKKGYQTWVGYESCATQIGVANKRSTAMASFVGSPVERPQMMPNAFGYAQTGFLGLIARQVLPATHPLIVLEIDQQIPVAQQGPEHYIPSHVAPEQIRRAFLGFSNWHDVKGYLVPPHEAQRWYTLSIDGRDAEGRPTGINIATAKPKENGYDQRWSIGEVLWRSDRADPAQTAQVLAKHPELGPTLEVLAQLQ
ncbi:MAG: hypothetical protein IPG45_19285 [Deltaproteobacteria bacterium]|nr:hypothetical protein [Deltaproteobacteria bacterium]